MGALGEHGRAALVGEAQPAAEGFTGFGAASCAANRRDEPPIPAAVLERAPSAELRPNQKDTDSLPPYELLDRILEAYVERDEGREEIVAAGAPAEIVEEVIRMVDHSEYKRRQAPPGIRITPKAFGRDRRLPITNRFSG